MIVREPHEALHLPRYAPEGPAARCADGALAVPFRASVPRGARPPGTCRTTERAHATPRLNVATVGIMAGNTLAPLCAYLMLRRVGFRVALDRLWDGLALVFLGALAGMLISATTGTAVLVLSGILHADTFWSAWSACPERARVATRGGRS
ncbi:hypothetical protein GCM10020367_19900 [Streptomyces sannanensis]|uniref:MASE1 domain-containing protein n=1 Tax=Streptomyces sannanensis TaxID=285536 RepID=A0ABP6S9A6_9ACTN